MNTVPTTKRSAETRKRRRRRSGDDHSVKLSIPRECKDEKNFEYRWINDTVGGRVQSKTKMDDWDIVTTQDLPDYPVDPRDIGEGSQIKRVVGAQGTEPLYAYLCRKPREFYEEDKAKERERIDALEEEMRRGPVKTSDGLDERHGYVPGGRNTIQHGG